mmetsp:Transcript_8765/g.13323  ORF Transcript_8765/g.13323 Transcript_8765/m.13323 type:complete len:292 (-) Transcript_8765:89-964(-)
MYRCDRTVDLFIMRHLKYFEIIHTLGMRLIPGRWVYSFLRLSQAVFLFLEIPRARVSLIFTNVMSASHFPSTHPLCFVIYALDYFVQTLKTVLVLLTLSNTLGLLIYLPVKKSLHSLILLQQHPRCQQVFLLSHRPTLPLPPILPTMLLLRCNIQGVAVAVLQGNKKQLLLLLHILWMMTMMMETSVVENIVLEVKARVQTQNAAIGIVLVHPIQIHHRHALLQMDHHLDVKVVAHVRKNQRRAKTQNYLNPNLNILKVLHHQNRFQMFHKLEHQVLHRQLQKPEENQNRF